MIKQKYLNFPSIEQRDKIQNFVKNHLKKGKKTCSDETIETIVTIFVSSNRIRNRIQIELAEIFANADALRFYGLSFGNASGEISDGFCLHFLRLEKDKTDPSLFFQLLKIDQEIDKNDENDWINPEVVANWIFYFKPMNIIKSDKVS